MTALVVGLAVAVGLLAVLLAALLRSQAALLRSHAELAEAVARLEALVPQPAPAPDAGRPPAVHPPGGH